MFPDFGSLYEYYRARQETLGAEAERERLLRQKPSILSWQRQLCLSAGHWFVSTGQRLEHIGAMHSLQPQTTRQRR